MITDWTVNFTGSPESDDMRAAVRIVQEENARRASANPPGTPLPFSNGAELKASTLTIMGEKVTEFFAKQREAAKQPPALDDFFSKTQIEEMVAALMTRAQASEAVEDIVADVTNIVAE